jgi:threonine/homoserine/homoserine lactone efflux protein
MTSFLTIGVLLGLSAGFAPGPLLTLVISETLQHDMQAGFKVALAPIITDLPIVILTVFILANLSGFHNVLGIISILGGLFILSMGYQNIRTEGIEISLQTGQTTSLTKGIIANALSPHPYLFWFSVGAPITSKAIQSGPLSFFAFIGSFYVLLVGSKMLLAALVGRSKSILTGNGYIYTMRILGLILCVFAIILFREGLSLLGVL